MDEKEKMLQNSDEKCIKYLDFGMSYALQ